MHGDRLVGVAQAPGRASAGYGLGRRRSGRRRLEEDLKCGFVVHQPSCLDGGRSARNRAANPQDGPGLLGVILEVTDDEGQQLGDRERAVLQRIDGSRTLEGLFDGSGLGSMDALRIVARLIRSGAIRVV